MTDHPELLLKCRVDVRDCPGGSATCGFICEAHFPEQARRMNVERAVVIARSVGEGE